MTCRIKCEGKGIPPAKLAGQLRYAVLVCLVYLGVLLHIWMDYLTSYGTQIFLPFDARRYTADAVFIIDYFYTGIIVTALLVIRMVRLQRYGRYRAGSLVGLLIGVGLWFSVPILVRHPLLRFALHGLGKHVVIFALVIALLTHLGRRWQTDKILLLGRCGVATLAAYMVLCMVSHVVATRRFANALVMRTANCSLVDHPEFAALRALKPLADFCRPVLGPQRATVQRVAAIPLPGGPLGWRGIAETASTYLVSRITLLPSTVAFPQVIPKGLDNGIVRTTSDYRLVRIFQDFARFPVIEYRQQGGEQIVRYFDLRFTGYGRDKSWFDLEVRLDIAGRVQVIEFLNRVFLPHHPDF
jgi:hypothetical protein